jgi:hypothetical protein
MNARLSIALLLLSVAGCWSEQAYQKHLGDRRQRLLQMYPPEKTTRADVRQKWAEVGAKPERSATRPSAGWADMGPDLMRDKAMQSEARTGKTVQFVDLYCGPDGFMSLCCCTFFFDEHERLTDALWEPMSD